MNSSVQRSSPSSPKIDSFCQINGYEETRDDVVFDENPNKKIEGREFNIKEYDMLQLLCKISQDNFFPEPRVIFYNKQNKRMQNNENINIGELHFFQYKRQLIFMIYNIILLMYILLMIIVEKKGPTDWVLTFRRCTIKDEGCYSVKAINSIGSDAKNWKISVLASSATVKTRTNMLLHSSCEEDPRGNQFDLQQKNKNVQSDSTSQLGKQLCEVMYKTLEFFI